MVIHDFDVMSVALQPNKTNAPLLINANAVVTFAIALQGFESVPRQRRERSDIRRGIQHVKFP